MTRGYTIRYVIVIILIVASYVAGMAIGHYVVSTDTVLASRTPSITEQVTVSSIAPPATFDLSNYRLILDTLEEIRPGIYRTTLIGSTGSMVPTIDCGHIVILEETQDVQIGDIIIYQRDDGTRIIHRIVGESDGCWVTKGDANKGVDNPTPKDSVIYRVAGILY
jgi:hypothetical protein